MGTPTAGMQKDLQRVEQCINALNLPDDHVDLLMQLAKLNMWVLKAMATYVVCSLF